MERQYINGIETRRRGEIIEQRTEKGWKQNNNQELLKRVEEREIAELQNRWPVIYRKL